MNSYLYGPKDDPYHSCPDWRLPYPEPEARQIRELVEACRRNYVDFVWAIHPGQDIRWNEEDYRNLVRKFEWMYDLGVRAFAIFFDDISGDGTDPGRQTELLNRLRRRFRPRQGRCRTARGLPDGLFAALGESHAAGQSGHLRADARPLGASLLDGRRRVQRPHARDARVGRFAYRPSGILRGGTIR